MLMRKWTLIKTRRGSFLIKTLVLVSALALISVFARSFIFVENDQRRIVVTRAEISHLEQSLGIFHLDNGFYPTTKQGLSALVVKPEVPPEPLKYDKKGYINKVPKDGWKRDFIYRSPGQHGDFDIISFGADGKKGGEGISADITNWE